MKPHKHNAIPEKTKQRCYSGCVNPKDENRSAHGNIVVIETCDCGAVRRTNVNGWHVEEGEWKDTV
jgi:hypothetical protein